VLEIFWLQSDQCLNRESRLIIIHLQLVLVTSICCCVISLNLFLHEICMERDMLQAHVLLLQLISDDRLLVSLVPRLPLFDNFVASVLHSTPSLRALGSFVLHCDFDMVCRTPFGGRVIPVAYAISCRIHALPCFFDKILDLGVEVYLVFLLTRHLLM
jgi:hypothetical protein